MVPARIVVFIIASLFFGFNGTLARDKLLSNISSVADESKPTRLYLMVL